MDQITIKKVINRIRFFYNFIPIPLYIKKIYIYKYTTLYYILHDL